MLADEDRLNLCIWLFHQIVKFCYKTMATLCESKLWILFQYYLHYCCLISTVFRMNAYMKFSFAGWSNHKAIGRSSSLYWFAKTWVWFALYIAKDRHHSHSWNSGKWYDLFFILNMIEWRPEILRINLPD